jgi:arylsulfatase A-like enzyme
MTPSDRKKDERRIDRRTFVKSGILAGGALVGAGWAASKLADATDPPGGAPARPRAPEAGTPASRAGGSGSGSGQPNILVILVDQLRYPQWIGPTAGGPGLPPNVQELREGGVTFANHYTASNDCTPARAALLTGLYTHQTGCLITGGSTLDAAFPTWGWLLRDQGYSTHWYGKWHLTHRDNHWNDENGPRALARYGFAGGTFPSPDGAPGQGWRKDPRIVEEFEEWFSSLESSQPWCTTVSFVNPHDIAWWYRFSDRVASEAQAPIVAGALPPNFETPEMLAAGRKPLLQRSLQETAARSFGAVPFTGAEAQSAWLPFLDLYLKLQLEVDRHVGRILQTLESRPEIAANTVIVFSADHGEYGASHGLRGKGAGAYDEAIRVPLIVKDPRGMLTAATEVTRNQLSSSVDVAPLLLTIGAGSNAWREEARYAHIARRLDLSELLLDPDAPGRPYVLHATDEIVTEFATEPYAAGAPLHVVAMRTPEAKYATYSNWGVGRTAELDEGRERELYDYSTQPGRLEMDNVAGESTLEAPLQALFEQAVAHELRRPLPARFRLAQERGFEDYFKVATRAALRAARMRAERGPEEEGGESGGAFEGALGDALRKPRAQRARKPRRSRKPGRRPISS